MPSRDGPLMINLPMTFLYGWYQQAHHQQGETIAWNLQALYTKLLLIKLFAPIYKTLFFCISQQNLIQCKCENSCYIKLRIFFLQETCANLSTNKHNAHTLFIFSIYQNLPNTKATTHMCENSDNARTFTHKNIHVYRRLTEIHVETWCPDMVLRKFFFFLFRVINSG